MGKESKHCVVTLVERKTGYTLIGQLNDRTTKSTDRRTIKLMSKMPEQFKTITSDNGTSFTNIPVTFQVATLLAALAHPDYLLLCRLTGASLTCRLVAI
ncbi:MAG: hypothetical protein QS721_02875 [Candidatus Endonucleobacter sp. (ex Gigantidas childressi)]|nr:hypothetical protein [Candidatus Endonucleobacter sp. (ex Gigantidas childressi)]